MSEERALARATMERICDSNLRLWSKVMPRSVTVLREGSCWELRWRLEGRVVLPSVRELHFEMEMLSCQSWDQVEMMFSASWRDGVLTGQDRLV